MWVLAMFNVSKESDSTGASWSAAEAACRTDN
jgi:hypothetical protein